MHETREFEFEGKTYEIRITSDGFTTSIRAFHDGKPANGCRYFVDMTTESDIKTHSSLSADPVEVFIKYAENDVRNRL